MIIYRFLADATVVIHFAYASFIVLGLLAILVGIVRHWSWIRNFWFRLVHLLMMGTVAAEACCGIPCPLTVWENRLRQLAGEATYPGSFIGTRGQRPALSWKYPSGCCPLSTCCSSALFS